MTPSSILATIGVSFSAVFGAGGVGYALVQWWIKRNDSEVQANSARVLTDAATGFIVELRKEKQTVLAELTRTHDDLHRLRITARRLIGALARILSDDQKSQLGTLVNDVEVNL